MEFHIKGTIRIAVKADDAKETHDKLLDALNSIAFDSVTTGHWDSIKAEAAEVSPYKYEINYLPEMIVPLSMIEFTRED
jgi:hypothetical protein